MAELKTKQTRESVPKFVDGIKEKQKREECRAILKMMQQITKQRPKMWGTSIVGFGSYHYVSKSGREGDWFVTGFSPRKQNITLYLMSGFGEFRQLMSKLGKYKSGKSCLSINTLEDVDLTVLKSLIADSVASFPARKK